MNRYAVEVLVFVEANDVDQAWEIATGLVETAGIKWDTLDECVELIREDVIA